MTPLAHSLDSWSRVRPTFVAALPRKMPRVGALSPRERGDGCTLWHSIPLRAIHGHKLGRKGEETCGKVGKRAARPLVPGVGFEPTCPEGQSVLSRPRQPVAPSGPGGRRYPTSPAVSSAHNAEEQRIRVDRGAAGGMHLEVQVRSGRVARRADVADDVAGCDAALLALVPREVRVVVGDVVDPGEPRAVASRTADVVSHEAGDDRDDRRVGRGGHVDALVEHTTRPRLAEVVGEHHEAVDRAPRRVTPRVDGPAAAELVQGLLDALVRRARARRRSCSCSWSGTSEAIVARERGAFPRSSVSRILSSAPRRAARRRGRVASAATMPVSCAARTPSTTFAESNTVSSRSTCPTYSSTARSFTASASSPHEPAARGSSARRRRSRPRAGRGCVWAAEICWFRSSASARAVSSRTRARESGSRGSRASTERPVRAVKRHVVTP